MKKVLLLLALSLSAQSYSAPATLEFDEKQERTCHAEAKAMGCLNAKGEENMACVSANKAKLSKTCQSMHATKASNQ